MNTRSGAVSFFGFQDNPFTVDSPHMFSPFLHGASQQPLLLQLGSTAQRNTHGWIHVRDAMHSMIKEFRLLPEITIYYPSVLLSWHVSVTKCDISQVWKSRLNFTVTAHSKYQWHQNCKAERKKKKAFLFCLVCLCNNAYLSLTL